MKPESRNPGTVLCAGLAGPLVSAFGDSWHVMAYVGWMFYHRSIHFLPRFSEDPDLMRGV